MSLGLAVRAFFLILFKREVAERVRAALQLPDSSPAPMIEKAACPLFSSSSQTRHYAPEKERLADFIVHFAGRSSVD